MLPVILNYAPVILNYAPVILNYAPRHPERPAL